MKKAPLSFLLFSVVLFLVIALIRTFEDIPAELIGLPIIVLAYGFIAYSIYFVFKNRYAFWWAWAVAFVFLPVVGHMVFWALFREKQSET